MQCRDRPLGLVQDPHVTKITGSETTNASHVTGRGGKTRLSCIQKSLQKSTCSARQESRTRVYRAPCWTNRIPDLFSSFFLYHYSFSLPYIRGSSCARTRQTSPAPIERVSGSRRAFPRWKVPVGIHSSHHTLSPFFFSSSSSFLFVNCCVVFILWPPNLLLLFLGEL